MPDDTISAEQQAEWVAVRSLSDALHGIRTTTVTSESFPAAVQAYEDAVTATLVAMQANGRTMPT